MAVDENPRRQESGEKPHGFDPYEAWLGIPRKGRVLTFYVLLGVSPTEQDPEVIRRAASRRREALSPHKNGEHHETYRRVIAEIAAAEAILCDPNQRSRYDKRVEREMRARGSAKERQGGAVAGHTQATRSAAAANGLPVDASREPPPGEEPPSEEEEEEAETPTGDGLLRPLQSINRFVKRNPAIAIISGAAIFGVTYLGISSITRPRGGPQNAQTTLKTDAPGEGGAITDLPPSSDPTPPPPSSETPPPKEEASPSSKTEAPPSSPPIVSPPESPPPPTVSKKVDTTPSPPATGPGKPPPRKSPPSAPPAVKEEPKDTRTPVTDVQEKANGYLRKIRTSATYQAKTPQELIDEAKSLEPAQQYSLYLAAAESAAAQGDIQGVIHAYARLRTNFASEDDFLAQESEDVKTCSKRARDPAGFSPVAQGLMLRHCQNGNFAGALDLAGTLRKKPSFTRTFGKSTGEILKLQRAYEEVQPHFDTLRERPDDREANQAVGFYLLDAGDFDRALAHLAKGDEEVRALAAATRQRGERNPEETVALARRWKTVRPDALSSGGVVKLISILYGEAGKRASGVARTAIQEEATMFTGRHGSRVPDLLRGEVQVEGAESKTDLMRQLTKLTDQEWEARFPKSGVSREWMNVDGVRRCILHFRKGATLTFPELKNVKSITVVFVQTPGTQREAITVNHPLNGERSVSLVIDGFRGSTVAYSRVNGGLSDNTKLNPTIRKSPIIQNARYTLTMERELQADPGGGEPKVKLSSFLTPFKGQTVPCTSYTGPLSSLWCDRTVQEAKDCFALHTQTDYYVLEVHIVPEEEKKE